MNANSNLHVELDQIAVTLDGHVIIDSITAKATAGRITALIGPNGAGKSTLLRALAGLNPIKSGAVSWSAKDGHTIRPSELTPLAHAKHVTWIPESSQVPFGFSALEAIVIGRFAWHQGRPVAADWRTAEEALTELGVGALAHRRIDQLSAGERQKVFTARALACPTPILLFDEPFANLDIGAALRFAAVLSRLASDGRTVIVALHDLALAQTLADDVWCLSAGKLIAAGPAADILTPMVIDPVFAVRTLAGEIAGQRGLWFQSPP